MLEPTCCSRSITLVYESSRNIHTHTHTHTHTRRELSLASALTSSSLLHGPVLTDPPCLDLWVFPDAALTLSQRPPPSLLKPGYICPPPHSPPIPVSWQPLTFLPLQFTFLLCYMTRPQVHTCFLWPCSLCTVLTFTMWLCPQ